MTEFVWYTGRPQLMMTGGFFKGYRTKLTEVPVLTARTIRRNGRGSNGAEIYVPSVETYYGWPSVSYSHWNYQVFGKPFPMFDPYSGNTGCWRWNKTSTSYLL